MSRYLSSRLTSLEEYVPGEQPQDKKYIKLNTNESPYPPSPAVIERLNAAEAANLKLYSDPELRRDLGAGAAEKAKLYEEESVHAQMKDIYLSVHRQKTLWS